MPSNVVAINGSKKLEWIVGDSKMGKLIEFLNKVSGGDDIVPCPKCSGHMEYITGEKPWKCPDCGHTEIDHGDMVT